jgi:uncharacterized Rossmann fold enzyme
VFAAGALLLCTIGAGIYRQVATVMGENYDTRTGILYVAEKVRQNDVVGATRVEQLNDTDALVLVEQVTGESYETWIYVQDGMLCEELIAAGSAVDLAQSQSIMPVRVLDLELEEGGLLRISITDGDGQTESIMLLLRSEGGDD